MRNTSSPCAQTSNGVGGWVNLKILVDWCIFFNSDEAKSSHNGVCVKEHSDDDRG